MLAKENIKNQKNLENLENLKNLKNIIKENLEIKEDKYFNLFS